MTHFLEARLAGGIFARLTRGAMLALLALGLPGIGALAQDAKPLASVGGEPITAQDLALATEDLGETLARFPEDQRQSVLLDVLINMKLLAKAARDAGIDQQADFKSRMAYLTERTLRDLYFTEELSKQVSEEELRKTYDETVAKIEPEEEVRARHILLKTKEDAEAVIKELEGGKDFAELATEKSTGPSAPTGGDLGYFTKERMVPEFATAAFAMEVGNVSAPVQTQFGWHVIKVEDKRKQPAPAFEDVKDQIKQVALRDRLSKKLEELKAATKVEITEPAEAPKPN